MSAHLKIDAAIEATSDRCAATFTPDQTFKSFHWVRNGEMHGPFSTWEAAVADALEGSPTSEVLVATATHRADPHSAAPPPSRLRWLGRWRQGVQQALQSLQSLAACWLQKLR